MKIAVVFNACFILWLVVGVSVVRAGFGVSDYRLKAGDKEFTLEIADTPAHRRLGLMHRKSIPASHGLLMVFEHDKVVSIWMKNVLLSLDVAWISAQGVVVDVQTLPPCTAQPCPSFRPRRAVRYVLEVGAGLFPLKPGDKVDVINADGDSLFARAAD